MGSDGFKANIRVINSRDNVIKNYFIEDGKYSQVLFVKPPSATTKISGFITGNDKGSLTVFSYPLTDHVYDYVYAHNGEITKLIMSPDNRYLFSCGQDGCIFIYKIGE